MTWYFPDISYYQPNAQIDNILAKSNGVLCIRAGHGDFKDPKFNTWRNQASNAKVLMIYQYVDKDDGTPERNADLFVSHLGGQRRSNEVLVMDVEPGSGSWTRTECQRFMDRVRSKVGGPPLMIYSNQGYITERGLSSLFTTSTGWIAKWGKAGQDTTKPIYPHIAWQHAADGFGKPRVLWPGCPKDTDENRVEVNPAEFVKRVLGTATAPSLSKDCCS